ncbi:7-carboxy-7-deazaguanine synthase QueE [Dactylosporangium darangshiense]|uniref:7-carboxy-7-deazaguanine synthase n=2 Tax=Dactylosporangium darangshiense TaxID=579108 RepID=A0ABP8DIG2_9ACTN
MAVAAATLRVAELFGPTFQGEGASVGQRAFFIRLSGCNLDCGWCDTPYTWDWSRFDRAAESRVMAPSDVLGWVLGQRPQLVVVTGGEPLLQQRALLPVLEGLHRAGVPVEIETNATMLPDPAVVAAVTRFNVSPKLTGSGVASQRRLKPEVLQALQDTGKTCFKFVIAGEDDVDEVAALQAALGLAPVWVMPEGTTPEAVLAGLRALAEPALVHGWNLTPRLHVLLWGDERGR